MPEPRYFCRPCLVRGYAGCAKVCIPPSPASPPCGCTHDALEDERTVVLGANREQERERSRILRLERGASA